MKKWVSMFAMLIILVVAATGCGGTSAAEDTGTGPVKEFTVNAKNYTFDPAEIKVKKGDRVKITLKNTEGNHSLKIAGYDKELQNNKSVVFTANKTGEFDFSCNLFCGEGHLKMKGKLIVE